MFTGIIKDIATIANITKKNNADLQITITTTNPSQTNPQIGDSIALNGICLTLTKKTLHQNILTLTFQASQETVSKTTITNWQINQKINLEFSLKIGDQIGGHFVYGHIDTIGQIINIKKINQSHEVKIKTPPNLAEFIATKGSITIDGISLTINEIENHIISLNIIEHTLNNTNLANIEINDYVNIEIDSMARSIVNFLKSKND
jgi:riboflavin synthase